MGADTWGVHGTSRLGTGRRSGVRLVILGTMSLLSPLVGHSIDRDWSRLCVGWSPDPETLGSGAVNDGVLLADRFIVLAGLQGNAYQIVDILNRSVEAIPHPPWSSRALVPAIAPIDDKRALVVAIDTESADAACAILDLEIMMWSATSCPTAWNVPGRDRRARLTVTDGQVFVFDGVNDPAVLDLNTMRWRVLSYPVSGVSFLRHTQVAIDGSRILVVASGTGRGRAVTYDLRSGHSQNVPAIPEARWAWSAVAVPGGAMFLGGRDADHRPSRRAFIYRTVDDKWHPTSRMQRSRSDVAAVNLGDGRVLAVGGWDARLRRVFVDEIYELDDNEWYQSGVPCTPRSHPLVFATPTDVFLVGGQVATGTRAAEGLRIQAGFERSIERWTPGLEAEAPVMTEHE